MSIRIMSIRIVPAILAAAVSVAFGYPPANAQQPQPPQSLRRAPQDRRSRRWSSQPANLTREQSKPDHNTEHRHELAQNRGVHCMYDACAQHHAADLKQRDRCCDTEIDTPIPQIGKRSRDRGYDLNDLARADCRESGKAAQHHQWHG